MSWESMSPAEKHHRVRRRRECSVDVAKRWLREVLEDIADRQRDSRRHPNTSSLGLVAWVGLCWKVVAGDEERTLDCVSTFRMFRIHCSAAGKTTDTVHGGY